MGVQAVKVIRKRIEQKSTKKGAKNRQKTVDNSVSLTSICLEEAATLKASSRSQLNLGSIYNAFILVESGQVQGSENVITFREMIETPTICYMVLSNPNSCPDVEWLDQVFEQLHGPDLFDHIESGPPYSEQVPRGFSPLMPQALNSFILVADGGGCDSCFDQWNATCSSGWNCSPGYEGRKVSARRSTLQVTPLAQPENVMLRTEVGPLVIIDFGLALPISMLKKGSPIGYI